MKFLGIFAFVAALAVSTAYATTDDESFFNDSEQSVLTPIQGSIPIHLIGSGVAPRAASLTPAEMFARTQSVLNYYKVPELPSSQSELYVYNMSQTLSGVQKLLPFIDAKNIFSKLFNLTATDLIGFDDIDNKSYQDFSIKLKPQGFRYNTVKIPNIPTMYPLKGVKIAIDPGHMGEDLWDKRTGKYVRHTDGRYLSEGILALQVSLLLKRDLENLGAEVLLTRVTADPVSKIPYEQLELEPYIKNEIRESIHQPWFQSLLSAGTGQKLFTAFDKSSQIKKLFSPSSRYTYYILREDLWSRANIINEFNPDITLIVHFDVVPGGQDGHGLNPKAPNQTKIFIAGGFLENELASRNTRKQFAKKLLDQKQWDDSVNLSKKILTQFNKQMGLTFPTGFSGSKTVAPGIFARNLGLTRAIDNSAIAYLECLFYNRPEEFNALTQYKYDMYINGKNYQYSDRLKQVADSIRDGVLDYVAQ